MSREPILPGDANFPEQVPWEGGRKVWYDSVFVLETAHGAWKAAGKLPRPLGYGVSLSVNDGVVVLCLLAMVGIGVACSRRNRSINDSFLGGQRIP